MNPSVSLPRSISQPYSGLIGAIAFVAALYICRHYGYTGVPATLFALVSFGGATMLAEILIFRAPADPRNGLDFSRFRFSAERSFCKIVAIIASYLFVAFWYWLFPEYHGNFFREDNDHAFYMAYGEALRMVLPVLVILGIPYVMVVDAVMQEPRDRLYWLGRLLLRKPSEITRSSLIQHAYILICRGYFLALLFVYVDREVNLLVDLDPITSNALLSQVFYAVFHFIIALGLVIAVSGFALALRLMGTHIRSIDPTVFGWWICLYMYEPFRSFVTEYYFRVPVANDPWIHALSGLAVMQHIWCGMLLLFLSAQLFADLNLGSRYSQLVNRGIVTGGLYRFTKHPSYLFAVLYIWFAFMPPLIFSDMHDIAYATFGLAGVTLVYYLRARTEERHLSRDPAYVDYALWIEQNGLFRIFGEWFPIMRFHRPVEKVIAASPAIYTGFAHP